MTPKQHLAAVLKLAKQHTTPAEYSKLAHWCKAKDKNTVEITGMQPRNYFRLQGKQLRFSDGFMWMNTDHTTAFAAVAGQLPAAPAQAKT